MPATVLGKRSRIAREKAALGADAVPQTLLKRTAFVIAADQENENPFVTPRPSKRARRPHGDREGHGEAMEVDELAQENTFRPQVSAKKLVVTATVPAKHGSAESRVALELARPKSTSTWAQTVRFDSATATSSPSTPRHRDAAADKVALTPRHRVGLVGKPLTPHTPRTPSTPRATAPTVYNQARQLFARSSEPGRLIGRDSERLELGNFISTRVQSMSSGCLYVSGPPGTGKSALVAEMCQDVATKEDCTQSYVNCMSIKNARDIYMKLFEDLCTSDGVLRGSEEDSLRKLIFAGQSSYLVVLDEIDHLRDVDQGLLYKLFEWSMDKASSLVLVGIANALDFTDRFLPRLKSRGLKPDLLPFMPYNAVQIAAVITGKLRSLLPADTVSRDHVPFVHPAAVLFLSKKVASATGDLRRAFDICRKAIDLIETETLEAELRKQSELTPDATPTSTPTRAPLGENTNLSSPVSPLKSSKKSIVVSPLKAQSSDKDVLQHLTIDTAPRATIAHLARVTSAVFNNGTTQRLQCLNLQQKAVLCALVGLEERNRQQAAEAMQAAHEPNVDTPSRRGRKSNASTMNNSNPAIAAPTIKSLYELYSSACRKENLLHPLTSTEFGDVVGGLETLSLVSGIGGKGGSMLSGAVGTPSRKGRAGAFGTPTGRKGAEERRLVSSIGHKEIRGMLEGVKFGRGILEGMLEGGDLF